MGNAAEIFRANWKYHLRPHALAACVYCLLTPFFFDVKDMDAYETAKTAETYLILLGIVCMVPVFLPDQDEAIRNVTDTKRTSVYTVCGIRLAQSLLLLSFLTGASLFFFRREGGSFCVWRYFGGAMAGMIFLGAIGMLAFSATNWMPLAYMAPLLYYAVNMGSGKKYLGNWYLDSMCAGSFHEKWYLFFTGIFLSALSFFLRRHAAKGSICARTWKKRRFTA